MEKTELLKYIGNLSQIGGCRHYTLSDGWGRRMRATTNVLEIVIGDIA